MHRNITAYTMLFAFTGPVWLASSTSYADKNTHFAKQKIRAKQTGVFTHPETGAHIDVGGGQIVDWGDQKIQTGYVVTITSNNEGRTKETTAFYDPAGNPGTFHITYKDKQGEKVGSHEVDLRTKYIHTTIVHPVNGENQVKTRFVSNKRKYQAAIKPEVDVTWEEPFVMPNMDEFLRSDSRAKRLRHHLSTTYSYNIDRKIDQYRNWVTIENSVGDFRGSIFRHDESPFSSTISKGFLHGFSEDFGSVKQLTSVLVSGPATSERRQLRSGDISFVDRFFKLADLSKYGKSDKTEPTEKSTLSDINTLIQTLDR